MKGPDGFVQAYNVQVAVDELLQLIVGQVVTQETNDKRQLMPIITIIERQSGDTPTQWLADAGYCSDVNLEAIADTNIDAYISTRKQKHGERPGPCPRGPLPKTATIIDRMSRKLHAKAGAAVYAARKEIVERVIGQIKQARGFLQFLLRGVEKVQGEWSLVYSQVVSPLWVKGRPVPSSGPIAHGTLARPSPRVATDIVGAQHEGT